jgi:hypothetical protein
MMSKPARTIVVWVLTHTTIGALEFDSHGRSWKTVQLYGALRGARILKVFHSKRNIGFRSVG